MTFANNAGRRVPMGGRRPGVLAGPAGATPVGSFYGCGDYVMRSGYIEFHTDEGGDLGNGKVYKLMDPGLLGTGPYDPINIGPAPNGRRRLCVGGTLYPGDEVWDIGSWGTERIGMSVPVQITPLGTPPVPDPGTSTNVEDVSPPPTGGLPPTSTQGAPTATWTPSGGEEGGYVPTYSPMGVDEREDQLDAGGGAPTSPGFGLGEGAAMLAAAAAFFILLGRDRRR